MAHSTIRVGLTGARGDFGRTLLTQFSRLPRMRATQLVDPDTAGVRTLLADLGESVDAVRVCAGIDEIAWDELDVIVEASGRVDAGYAYAAAAIAHGVHVVMVSKEVESVAGVALAAAAAERGVSYLPGDGDQPANLLRLMDWVEQVGLEVVALGKSGEYDLQFDPATEIVTQVDQTVHAEGLAHLLELDDDLESTLAARAATVAPLKRAAAADSCEMAVVSLYTGAGADVETMHYPVARPDELADIYARRADGGLIARDRSVDVFSMLRLPGEASFAGGVFAIVRTGDPFTWKILEGKGHVVSRDGRYACIYWPYHYMGVETPLSIDAAVAGAPTARRAPRQHTVLAARAVRDLAAGTAFTVAGHHHEIDGVAPVIVDRDDAVAADDVPDASPYYLLSGTTLATDVPAGALVRIDDLDGVSADVLAAFARGLQQ